LGANVAGFTCNPDFAISQIGTVTRWTPVKGLTLSGEVMYTYLDQASSGILPLTAAGTKPAATYEFKDQGVWSGNLRVQRNF
ncbi:MAG: porin, partial [Pseudomonadota bacterium]